MLSNRNNLLNILSPSACERVLRKSTFLLTTDFGGFEKDCRDEKSRFVSGSFLKTSFISCLSFVIREILVLQLHIADDLPDLILCLLLGLVKLVNGRQLCFYAEVELDLRLGARWPCADLAAVFGNELQHV